MSKYYLRLDDAAPKRNVVNWNRMEELLDKYNVKPLVGVIPDCQDPNMAKYEEDGSFWSEIISKWQNKGWTLALHGYQHVFCTSMAGVNPVNKKSEFAGVSLQEQKNKIKAGVNILREHGINPQVFFAPAHTFDENTIVALKEESDIYIISDTPANKPYERWNMTFVPQQAGKVRNLTFNTITFCYHPNTMTERDFIELELYLKKNKFSVFAMEKTNRKLSVYDKILMALYYWRHSK